MNETSCSKLTLNIETNCHLSLTAEQISSRPNVEKLVRRHKKAECDNEEIYTSSQH